MSHVLGGRSPTATVSIGSSWETVDYVHTVELSEFGEESVLFSQRDAILLNSTMACAVITY